MFVSIGKKCVLVMLAVMVSLPLYAEKLDGIAAVINDQVITDSQLNAEVKTLKQRLSMQKVEEPPLNVLRRQVVDHLVNIELQLQLAERNNLSVSDQALSDSIKKIAKNNHMSVEELKTSMKHQGLTWDKYKENVKKEMLLSQVQQGAVGRVSVSDDEVDGYLKANKQNSDTLYHIKDLVLSLPDAPSPEVVAKARAKANSLMVRLKKGLDFSKASVSESSGEFAFSGGDLGLRRLAELPEMFVDEVNKMKKDDIRGPIRAPNGFHIIKLVEVKGQAAKQLVKLTHVSHILLKVEPGQSADDVKKKLDSIVLQMKRGRKFTELAKKFSDDEASAKNGGDIGWIHKGEVVPQFEEAMNKLKEGEISEPVKTDYGWHVIKVEGRKVIDDSKAYQRESIRQALYRRKFFEAVQNWVQQLRAGSYVKVLASNVATE